MSGRDLDAAGITDPALRASYASCRRLNAAHGKTYYLATRLLPPAKRPYVHALYGFARYADDLVDETETVDETVDEPAGRPGAGGVVPAFEDTLRRWDIPRAHVEAFLASMRMDLDTTAYATFADLTRYVHGSAAVIGLQMVPVLEHPGVPREVVEPYAADLGIAFQLSNFLRDVGEDLRRGRLYLPQEDLAAFDVTREQLEAGVVDGRVRRLLAFEIARTREIYRSAFPGIRLLHPTSRDCVETAYHLYAAILDEVERADYRVLDRRVAVSLPRRLAVAGPAWLRARRASGRETLRRDGAHPPAR